MLKKLLLSFCLLLTQSLLVTEAHAYPGYTSWNDAVQTQLGCNGDNILCVGTLEPNKPVFSVQYDCIYGSSVCIDPKNTIVYGNDSLVLFNMYKAQLASYVQAHPEATGTEIITPPPTNGNNPYSFTVLYHTSTVDYHSPHGIGAVPISCNYIEALGLIFLYW